MHITGDGLLNLPRVDAEIGFVIDELPEPPPLFGLIEKLDSTETLLMGSDWPHAEGLREPADFWNKVEGLDDTTKRAFLRENGMKLSSGIV